MAEFKEVIKQKQRMHEHFLGRGCDNCPISRDINGYNLGCATFMGKHPQEAEKIIMKWAEENPIKTNVDKFEEVFGFVPQSFCPHMCGNNSCSTCVHNTFWEDEYKEFDKE